MKDKQQQQEFINLRANGKSFDFISKQLNIAKNTLIKWNKDLHKEVSNLEYLQYQDLIEQFSVQKQERIKALLERQKKLNESIFEIDYSSLSAKDLLLLQKQTEKALKQEIEGITFYTGTLINPTWNFDLVEEETIPIVI